MIEAHSLESLINKVSEDLPRKILGTKHVPIENNHLEYVVGFDMSKSNRFRRVNFEKIRTSKLIGILFCRPNSPIAGSEILGDLTYFHFRSGESIDFFCAGYGAYWPPEKFPGQIPVAKVANVDWFFSAKSYIDLENELEAETCWKPNGEAELILIMAHKGSDNKVTLDYQSAVVCRLEQMIRDKAITSARAFFESIFISSKDNGADTTWGFSDRKGIEIGKSTLKEAILSLLPKSIAKGYKRTEHFVVQNISKKAG